MMDIFNKNYEAIVKRGLITKDTRDYEFLEKAIEEKDEIINEFYVNDIFLEPKIGRAENLNEEITDLMNVCANWLIHRGLNPLEELEKCYQKNINRND